MFVPKLIFNTKDVPARFSGTKTLPTLFPSFETRSTVSSVGIVLFTCTDPKSHVVQIVSIADVGVIVREFVEDDVIDIDGASSGLSEGKGVKVKLEVVDELIELVGVIDELGLEDNDIDIDFDNEFEFVSDTDVEIDIDVVIELLIDGVMEIEMEGESLADILCDTDIDIDVEEDGDIVDVIDGDGVLDLDGVLLILIILFHGYHLDLFFLH